MAQPPAPHGTPDEGDGSPVYLAGLDLRGRRVLVAGAGRVATRRIQRLLDAEADVIVVAPEASAQVHAWASARRLAWEQREVVEADVDASWYVLAATGSPEANAALAAAAEQRHTFCVRADDAAGGSAWTPATGTAGPLTVGVIGRGNPRLAASARDIAVRAVRQEAQADGGDRGRPRPGTVTLVGGGPGDPDLLTVAALRALQTADVIFTDHLAPDVARLVPDGVEVVNVGKIPHGPSTPQEAINDLLVNAARAGRRVVRLKGGDSYVFGRGGEEALACAKAGVAVRVIPGVTSAVGVPALAGVPVTHRSLSQGFTVVSGHVPPGDGRSSLDWAALARTHTTLVILMGVKHLAPITDALRAGGLDAATPAIVVAGAYRPDMQVVRGTASTIAAEAAAHGVRPPAITVIGDVAGLDLTAPPAT